MGKARKFRGPKTIYDLVNDIDPQFATEVHSMKEEDLMGKLAQMAKDTTTFENEKEKDQDIKSLREQLKVASSTYNEPIKALKLKRKLVYKILEDRGRAP